MDEQAIRAIVRQAVAKQLGAERPSPLSHVSHIRYLLPESDGPCLIEPTVPCNHCGYCQSHGH